MALIVPFRNRYAVLSYFEQMYMYLYTVNTLTYIRTDDCQIHELLSTVSVLICGSFREYKVNTASEISEKQRELVAK